jgi:hypothetical protein
MSASAGSHDQRGHLGWTVDTLCSRRNRGSPMASSNSESTAAIRIG